jgi:MOSC domain-containing protein YiiM
MTTLAQSDLPKDPGILRTAAQHNQANVGAYASVVQGGVVRRGDVIRLEGGLSPTTLAVTTAALLSVAAARSSTKMAAPAANGR